ncbi:MAG: 3,4-dihydroxy-2-butanone-4-phosphate synthase [Candidatus Thermoplasmatota archaeon]
MEKIKEAIDNLKQGKFVLIYDGDSREGETDLVLSAKHATWKNVRTMRNDGGGLIFIMLSYRIADKLNLPFLSEMFSDINNRYPVLKSLVADDIPYDNKSSFSLYINHRDTFTGITDFDRSLTMRKIAELSKKIKDVNSRKAVELFGDSFRTPGHIPICKAAEGLIDSRRGHTELVVSLLMMAGIVPVGCGCEMMGDDGKALSKKESIDYAERNGLVFLEGKDIVETWKKWSKK